MVEKESQTRDDEDQTADDAAVSESIPVTADDTHSSIQESQSQDEANLRNAKMHRSI